MIPWELIDRVHVPESGEEICLHKHGNDFSIRVNGYELMNSRSHGSEEILADMACEKIVGRSCPRVLIGGLGMGYTASAALRHLGPDGRVVVAEIVPAVVVWNRGPLGDLAGHPVDDPRTMIHEGDIVQVFHDKKQAYDAILLDVDNGPEGLTRKENNWLYSHAGLKAAIAILRPSGVLAIWSAGPDRAFTHRLTKVGFEVKESRVRARVTGKGSFHTIWIAVRRP